MLACSIDLETTGIDYEKCQIIEIGVAVDDLSPGKIVPLKDVPKFQTYVLRGTYMGEPRAFSMHSKILARMAEREPPYSYLWPGEVAKALHKFLKPFRSTDDGKITAIGKNFASFDLAFLRADKAFKDVVPLFRGRVIDVGDLFLLPSDEKVPGTEECMRRAEALVTDHSGNHSFSGGEWHALFDKPTFAQHNALDDALQVLYMLGAWRASKCAKS